MKALLMLLIMLLVPVALVGYAALQLSQLAASPSRSSPPSNHPAALPGASAVPSSLPVLLPPETALTPETARATVRAWFEALAMGDYQGAEALTTGAAATKTRAAIDQITQQAGQRGIAVTATVQQLDFAPASGAPQDGQAVRAAFDMAIKAGVGPLSVDAGHVQGGATFVVQKVQEGIRITDIRDATGLTGSS